MKYAFLLLALEVFVACSPPQTPELGKDWKSIQQDLQARLITAADSSVIELPPGSYMFKRSLLMDQKRGITILGAGIDQTILSFEDQEEGAEGIRISNCTGITLADFTIENASGDNIKVTDTRGITFRNIKSQWTGNPDEANGAYAFYPVLCTRVLIEKCIAIGASDAGIYVGQSDTVIVRENEASWNVAGIESENSKWVDIYNNHTHDNTGGILVFDLPGLTQLGHSTRVYNNLIESNNFRNFAPEGNVVATVPPGTGIMLLATRKIEIFDNQIIDNRTAGTAIASYDIVEALATGAPSQLNANIEKSKKDLKYDPYPNNIYIHHNLYSNSHWFPTLRNDFGLLFLYKFPFATPDVVWDGILSENYPFQMCIEQPGIEFGNLDAANDFEGLTTQMESFECIGEFVDPVI